MAARRSFDRSKRNFNGTGDTIMKAIKMEKGKKYLFRHEPIELSFYNFGSNLVIVNPPGECDTQSKFGISIDAEVTEISEDVWNENYEGYCSPYNGGYDDD